MERASEIIPDGMPLIIVYVNFILYFARSFMTLKIWEEHEKGQFFLCLKSWEMALQHSSARKSKAPCVRMGVECVFNNFLRLHSQKSGRKET